MKSPAFQFYPTDYLGSQRVQMMTLEEEGAYCRLLWSCWQHGSIPADPELAARLVGKGCSTTVARVVLPMFEVTCGEGRLTHDRLERERAKQAEWREKSSAGGKKSAEMREKAKGGSTVVARVVQPPHQPNGNTLSSVSGLQSSYSDSVPDSKTPSVPPEIPTPAFSKPAGEVLLLEPEKTEPPDPVWEPTEPQLRLGALFRRRPSTRWSKAELKAYRAILPIDEEDVEHLERYYNGKHPPSADFRRHDLATLLNNFTGEVDRARNWKPQNCF